MVHLVAAKYGQLPRTIDALPVRERHEMIDFLSDLPIWEKEAYDRAREEGGES